MADSCQLPAECEPVLRALVRPLRHRMSQLGWSQEQLGARLGCDRSRVSRALSGREVPPQHLIEQIAKAIGADADRAIRRWEHADQLRRNARRPPPDPAASATPLAGGPPAGLQTYADLLRGLRDLMHECRVSQRELCRRDHRLRRSTVGAVLRGSGPRATAWWARSYAHAGSATRPGGSSGDRIRRPSTADDERATSTCARRTPRGGDQPSPRAAALHGRDPRPRSALHPHRAVPALAGARAGRRLPPDRHMAAHPVTGTRTGLGS